MFNKKIEKPNLTKKASKKKSILLLGFAAIVIMVVSAAGINLLFKSESDQYMTYLMTNEYDKAYALTGPLYQTSYSLEDHQYICDQLRTTIGRIVSFEHTDNPNADVTEYTVTGELGMGFLELSYLKQPKKSKIATIKMYGPGKGYISYFFIRDQLKMTKATQLIMESIIESDYVGLAKLKTTTSSLKTADEFKTFIESNEAIVNQKISGYAIQSIDAIDDEDAEVKVVINPDTDETFFLNIRLCRAESYHVMAMKFDYDDYLKKRRGVNNTIHTMNNADLTEARLMADKFVQVIYEKNYKALQDFSSLFVLRKLDENEIEALLDCLVRLNWRPTSSTLISPSGIDSHLEVSYELAKDSLLTVYVFKDSKTYIVDGFRIDHQLKSNSTNPSSEVTSDGFQPSALAFIKAITEDDFTKAFGLMNGNSKFDSQEAFNNYFKTIEALYGKATTSFELKLGTSMSNPGSLEAYYRMNTDLDESYLLCMSIDLRTLTVVDVSVLQDLFSIKSLEDL